VLNFGTVNTKLNFSVNFQVQGLMFSLIVYQFEVRHITQNVQSREKGMAPLQTLTIEICMLT
jgi:hypothetical protein